MSTGDLILSPSQKVIDHKTGHRDREIGMCKYAVVPYSIGTLLKAGLREPGFEQAAPKSERNTMQCIQISKFLALLTFEKRTRTVQVARKKRRNRK